MDSPILTQLQHFDTFQPVGEQHSLAPAIGCLYEWKDYFLEYPGADSLQAGTWECESIRPGLFRLRFENQLGLTALQPFAAGRPLEAPVYVEVLSTKFPTPTCHLAFYRTLLSDLFAQAAQLPFTISGPTARAVTEATTPPTPLFAYYFLCQYAGELTTALTTIQARPHRELQDNPQRVPLAAVTEADADILLSILHAPEEWQPVAPDFPLAAQLNGHAPTHVWQRCSIETTDTPPNRFVRAFVRDLLAAADMLPAQRWWMQAPPKRRDEIQLLEQQLQQALHQAPLAEAGPLHHLPLTSQVLLRRDGYRELLPLWQRFQGARRPLFAALQQAMEVRDIAQLYEIWVFFRLVKEIQQALGEEEKPPVLTLTFSDEYGLHWGAEARYGSGDRLLYNHTYRLPHSYSVALRPDFAWVQNGKLTVVLDAKFRLEQTAWQSETSEAAPGTTVKQDDLYKMHTYRDALGVRAAVALYPGDQACFYRQDRPKDELPTLAALLTGELAGVGALPMQPETTSR